MSRISNFFKALQYDGFLSKNEVFRRLNCQDLGHDKENSSLLDKVLSEGHPWTDSDFIYTINIMHCPKCGATFQDNGLEFRNDQ